MKKYWIKDLTHEQGIHAPTIEIAERLLRKFHELGLTWYGGCSYLEEDKSYFPFEMIDSIYFPKQGTIGSMSSLFRDEWEVITIDQLYDFNN